MVAGVVLGCGLLVTLVAKPVLPGDCEAEVRSDIAPVTEVLPGLGEVTQAHWAPLAGAKDAGCPLIPYQDPWIEGVAVLGPGRAEALRGRYDWAEVAQPGSGIAPELSGFVPAGAGWWHSAEFDESAVAASADGGVVYVDLARGVAYFRVIP